MEQLLLKVATTTATDAGEFEAVISTASIDREKDIVDPEGFVRALQKWTPTGKKIPLAWNHSTSAEEQIGHIDPATVKAVGNEVHASGWVDQSTDVGKHVWRLVKSGTLGFSFGYLILKGTPRKGGGRHITELDVFEVTATTTPMNAATRVLSYKASKQTDAPPTATQMRILNSMIGQAQEYIASDPDAEDAAEMADVLETLEELRGEPGTEDEGDGMMDDDMGKSVREQAEKLARDLFAKAAPDKTALDLQLLREQHEEQAAQLKTATEELDAARKQLAERGTDLDMLRRAGEALTLEAVKNHRGRSSKREDPETTWVVPEDELAGAKTGALKAVWTTAYVNSLPDSAFLYVEPGGSKDEEGKTVPRDLRHFPYKDASGAVDLPHLRNALSRIPQAQSLSQELRDSLAARAQKILENQKALVFDPDVAVDVTDRALARRSVDPLVQEAKTLALQFRSAGIGARPPREKQEAPRPELDENELRREMRNLMVTALRGGS